MIVDNNYKKFNINKLNRTGGNISNGNGTVYLGSGNKVTENISAIQPHYLWGNLFNGTQDIDGDIDFKGNINFVGDDDGYHGNINAISAVLKNLTVTGSAYFAELVIDKIKAAGGAVILSPADGFEIIKIETVTNGVKLYFLAEANDKKIMNMWTVDDQLIIKDFNNASLGTSLNVSNRYFWGIVTGIDSTPVDIIIEGGQTVSAHYVIVSDSDYDGSLPDDYYIGANCVQLGNRTDTTRQGAIYLSAYSGLDTTLDAPFVALYDGINDFNLSNHRVTWFSMNGSSVKGELHVYDNANERVDISPHSVGIVDDYNWNTENKTVIGVDGMYSCNTYGYFWNGPDEIDLSYGNHRLMLDSTGIKRTIRERTWNGNTKTDIYSAVPYYDISHVNNITKITPSSSVNSYDLDKDDGFVVVYNNNPQIAVNVNLPDPNVSTGCRLYIKGLHDVTVSRSGRIIKEGDSAAVNSVFIENDAYMFICDGTYWFAFSGV